MKKIYFLTLAVFFSFLLNGQSVLHYDFTNSLAEVNGDGPALTVLGVEGTYEQDTLGEVGDTRKWVYRFEKNSGVQFNNLAADNFLGEEYTIEIYFVFDELSSWKRVVDWKNRKTDYGAYVYYGKLNFYNIITSNEAPVVAGEYTYYVITRDANTKELIIYTDAEQEISFIDNSGHALIDEDNVLNFFHDDVVVPNEASTGAVAMIKLYNYALDSNEIKEKYDDLAGNLFFIGEDRKTEIPVTIYPNPSDNEVRVDLHNFGLNEEIQLTILNSMGTVVFKNEVNSNQIQVINTLQLGFTTGIYYLTAESGEKRSSGKLLITK